MSEEQAEPAKGKHGGARPNSGRPTTADTLSRREAFRKHVPDTKLRAIIQAQVAKAIEGDTVAAKLILDGRFGPEIQRSEITGKDGKPIQFEHDLSELQKLEPDALIRIHRETLGDSE